MGKFKGNTIFEGIAIAKPYIKKRREINIHELIIEETQIDTELERVQVALKETRFEIKQLIDSLKDRVNKNELKILNVQLVMLEDPLFLSDINNLIKKDRKNSEFVIDKVVKKYVGMFKSLNDPVYRERATDVEEVGNKLLQNLLLEKPELEDINNKIIITKELKPFEILKYYNQGVIIKGIATEEGGETSHAAILAKALGIPTIMGMGSLEDLILNENKDIILDSREDKALLITEPSKEEYEVYLKEYKKFTELNIEIEALRGKEVLSKDGKKILLKANLGGEIEISQLKLYQPDGVGLLRTEFLYMDNDEFPSEEVQYNMYEKVYNELGDDKPLIIRTLDIGGDKTLSYFKLPEEENPFLGLRAIRLCLKNPDIFKVQLRALLRVSYNRNIKIMIPMISRVEEIWESKKIIDEIKKEFDIKEIKYNKDVEIGIMVEVPSAAILADQLIDEVDFFSIGTNDLTQYVMAADRLSKEVYDVYDKYNPSVIRMIAHTVEAANNANKAVSICGETAGELLGMLIFLSLGVTELSMLPAFLPKAKKLVRNIDIDKLKTYKKSILKCKTAEEIKDVLKDFY